MSKVSDKLMSPGAERYEIYSSEKYPNGEAMRLRNARARELRKQGGFKVRCETTHFEGLGYGTGYFVRWSLCPVCRGESHPHGGPECPECGGV